MAYCGPSCAVPSCASLPSVGFGSGGGRGLGCGGFGSGGLSFGGLGSGGLGSGGLGSGGLGSGGLGSGGFGYGYGASGLATTSGNLGTLAGVNPQPINQIPASEVTIQPPACVVVLPGAILSASCEPIGVGGNSPCAPGGIGPLGGGYLRGRLGRFGRRGSICYPCNLPC